MKLFSFQSTGRGSPIVPQGLNSRADSFWRHIGLQTWVGGCAKLLNRSPDRLMGINELEVSLFLSLQFPITEC
jgi:hypothetical protein